MTVMSCLMRLPISGLVPLEERVDVSLLERQDVAELPGDVNGSSDVFTHYRRFDGVFYCASDSEYAVITHKDNRRTGSSQCFCHQATNILITNGSEWANRDFAAKLIRHRGEDTRNGFTPGSPRGCIR